MSGSFLSSQTGPAGVATSSTNVFWLKADAGTSSTVNNTAISLWSDQSGNSIDVTQTVSAQQPLYTTNVINGFPAILFDNSTTSNQNDKMIGPDSPILDNTSGYTFFMVTRPMSLDNSNARAIISKRTTVSVDESFMLFYYTSNKLNIDVQTTDNRFASGTTFSNSTNFLSCLIYDGSVATASRCALYSEETFDKYASETNSLVPDNSSPILIGTTDAGDGRPYGGYIAEIIIYREALTSVSRIIVNNYLSAKYNIALSANDKYLGDNTANGDYDREVAGLGQETTGSNPSFSASISGGITIAATAGLNNADYILAGHAVATNTTIISDVGGMTGSNNARWLRIWYVDVTNTSTNINTNIEFDMSDGGMGAFTLGAASNYVLLYRAGQSGSWTELSSASSVSGDRVQFSNITLTTDGYYTLGTRDFNNSPLPIELVYFDAVPNQNQVDLSWQTASEKNTKKFIIEKTRNGIDFEMVASVSANGQSSSLKNYKDIDTHPYPGLSYYRLTEMTMGDQLNHFPLVAVSFGTDPEFVVFPNPSENVFYIQTSLSENSSVKLSIHDLSGKGCYEKNFITTKKNEVLFFEAKNKLNSGTYLLSVSFMDKTFSQKIILK